MKHLTRYFLCIIAVLSLVTFTSCKDSKSELKQAVNATNADLPAQISPYMSFDKIEYTDDNLIMSYTIDDSTYDLDALKANKDISRQNVISMLSSNNEETKKLVTLVRECNAAITLRYTGKHSGRSAKITISADEIKNLSSADYDEEEIIDNNIELLNAQCPITLDECTVMQSVKKTNDHLVYNYRLIGITIDDVDASGWKMIKNSVSKEFNKQSNKVITNALKNTGRDIKCIYTDEAGYSYDFTVNL